MKRDKLYMIIGIVVLVISVLGSTLVREGNLGSNTEGDVITIATDELIDTTYTVYL